MPAPDGPNTLAQALDRLNAANIELHDIGLRRPSLDEVFLALTAKDARDKPAAHGAPDGLGRTALGRRQLQRNDVTPAAEFQVGESRPVSGRHRSDHGSDAAPTPLGDRALP
jgi:hypothetical protein